MEKELKSDGAVQLVITSDEQGIKITYDEKDKVISIETSGGNKIILSDKDKSITLKDQHKNTFQMDENGITIESVKDINLKAKMNINIESGMTLNQKAKADIKSEGTNIEAKAKLGIKMQGAASAELSASGQTVVKGGMVMIN